MREKTIERLDYRKIGADKWRDLGTLAATIDKGSLSRALLELVKLRASQINGCANCVNLHANRLRAAGETEDRIQNVVVWWEATCFDTRENAALAWTDAVTLVAETHVPDDVYARVAEQFNESELTDLTFAICTINTHNRLAVAFRRAPGS
jgi:AhpD family alkylhydroperoxidase